MTFIQTCMFSGAIVSSTNMMTACELNEVTTITMPETTTTTKDSFQERYIFRNDMSSVVISRYFVTYHIILYM